jgi:hypothetical protein
MIVVVTYKMGEVAKSSNNLFVNKFSRAFSHIVSKCLYLYPFGGIIGGHYDILVSFIFCCRFDWSHEIKTPFHKRFKSHN